jgi:hypothetical protein
MEQQDQHHLKQDHTDVHDGIPQESLEDTLQDAAFEPTGETTQEQEQGVLADPANEADQEDVAAGPTYRDRGDSEHVLREYSVLKPLQDPWDDEAPTMYLSAAPRSEVKEVLESLSESKQNDIGRNQEWVAATGIGMFHAPAGDFHSDLTEREGSAWRQAVKREDGRVMALTRPPKYADTDTILTGAAAVARMNSILSIGGTYRIPLWHSGFWITLRAPSDGRLLELDRMMAEEKIQLGRQTSGLLYSNESVFQLARLVNFALDHLESTTLKDGSRKNIMEMMDCHDAQTLAWGLACAIWPNGFQYARAILGKTPAENKVIKGLVNVSKLQWIDTNSLTDKQIRHMSRVKEGCITNEEIAAYKNEFRNRERQIVLDENARVNLGVPSIAEHIERGQSWVNSIVVNNDRAFGMDQDEAVRNSFLNQQANATILRQYGHWVKSIELGNGVTGEGDRGTVDDLLDRLSQEDRYRNLLMNGIIQYCEDTTFCFIGVPTANDAEEDGRPADRKHVLGVDIFAYFFTLLRSKLQQIATRNLTVMYA